MRAALLAVVLGACTHHRAISEAHELVGEEVVVEGRDARRVMVGVVAPEGAAFRDRVSGDVLRTHEIVTIEDVRHGRGALDGLAVGGGVGIVVGAIAGYASGGESCDSDQDDECWLRLGREGKALVGAVVVGSIGAIVGLVVGAVKGSTIIYDGERTSVRADSSGLTMTF